MNCGSCYGLSASETFVDQNANWTLSSGSPRRAGASAHNNNKPAFVRSNFSSLVNNASDIYGSIRSVFDIGALGFVGQSQTSGDGRMLLR